MNQEQRDRLDDFRRRAAFDAESVFEDPSVGSYIAVHPMADENEVLTRLGLAPEACTRVDCYWKWDDDVYFLQIESTKYLGNEPGLWARMSPGELPYVNLVAVVEEGAVTRETTHRTMRLFQPLLRRTLELGEELVRIDAQQK